jgi:hypothetical protein
MTTHVGDEDSGLELTLSVWTPTAGEAAAYRALEDKLAQETTPEAIREARREIDEHFREMQHRHRDDPLHVPADPAAVEAFKALQLEDLEKQLRELDDEPPGSPDPNSN